MDIWYQYVIDNKKYWLHGFTLKRLKKIQPYVFANEDIRFDLLQRHNGSVTTPEDMKRESIEWFNHCIGNFVGNIHCTMHKQGLL